MFRYEQFSLADCDVTASEYRNVIPIGSVQIYMDNVSFVYPSQGHLIKTRWPKVCNPAEEF
jgi:hypothetical protein